jgi:hypothetical protein
VPIKLEIFGETVEAFNSELNMLTTIIRPVTDAGLTDVTVTLPSVIEGASLEELRQLITRRFETEGYEVKIAVRGEEPDEEPEPPTPPTKKKKGGRPPLVDAETAAKTLKSNGADHEPASHLKVVETVEDLDPEPDPDADKAFVIDVLSKVFKDPKTKPLVTAFASRMTKTYGGELMTDIAAEHFPAIRPLMEKEFDA